VEKLRLLAPAPLADAHDIAAFDSGVPALDDWLKRRARANHAGGASRVFILANEAGQVAGYYALAAGAISLSAAPGSIRRNMPDPIPMAVLGRLAIDRRCQGNGLGAALLKDAVLRLQGASDVLGMRGILVHAISDEARLFYERHGFLNCPDSPRTLIMSLARAAG
jgi:GNAT superfamily N-acetyltransferase